MNQKPHGAPKPKFRNYAYTPKIKTMHQAQYYVGVLFSGFGFGVPRAIQKRYFPIGLVYTLVDGAFFIPMLTCVFINKAGACFYSFFSLKIISSIVQMLDATILPSHYKLVPTTKNLAKRFKLHPWYKAPYYKKSNLLSANSFFSKPIESYDFSSQHQGTRFHTYGLSLQYLW